VKEERQAALAALHHQVQAGLKEANSPANRQAREERVKALDAKKEKLEKERLEKLKQKRELQKQEQLNRNGPPPSTGL